VRELFVWYRVRDDRVVEARAAVRAMQDALGSKWPGLQARLLTRDDVGGGQTWMETYARDGGAAESRGIDAAIEDGIATAALSLAALIESPRHVEAFVVGVPT
jgi:hypothetical protein